MTGEEKVAALVGCLASGSWPGPIKNTVVKEQAATKGKRRVKSSGK